MSKRKGFFVVLFLALLLLAGCGIRDKQDAGANISMPASPPSPAATSKDMATTENMARPSPGGIIIPDGSLPSQGQQRLIRNADLNLEVPDLMPALASLEQLARQAGGMLTNSSFSGREQQRSASVTARVPEAAFDQFLLEAKKFGKVITRHMYTSDVTRQYIDLEARINNLRRQEQRLHSILEQAKTVREILDIEKELERVRGQLESLTGEFRYLRDQVQYATVNIHLTESPKASPVITGAGLRGVWQRGLLGLTASINGLLASLANALVFLLTALPYLLTLAIIVVPLAFLALRRLKKHTKTDLQAPMPEVPDK